MILVICLILLLASFIWPFTGGYFELKRGLDPVPLFIDGDYRKDPRYFAISFKKIFSNIINENERGEGIHSIKMSKKEMIEVSDNCLLQDKMVVPNIYYVRNNLISGRKVFFEKEVYVQGIVSLGENNQLRALACDRDVELLKGTKLYRWLDAEGDIKVEEGCNLGISATCAGKLSIARNCSFRRLYGFPIVTGTTDERHVEQKDYLPNVVNTIVAAFENEIERDVSKIPEHSRKDCSIINSKKLIIGDNVVIRGHVKVNEELIIGKNVIILGNVFAEKDIRIGAGSHIFGTVFSQESVILETGVVIGSKGRIKSVVAKKSIILKGGVTVYGFINTEKGRVAA